MSINKLKTIILAITIAITGTFSLPLPTFAGGICPEGSLHAGYNYEENIGECNIAPQSGPYRYFSSTLLIVDLLLLLILIASLVVIIVGTIKYFIYRNKKDKKDKVKNAKKLIKIGVIVFVVALPIFIFAIFIYPNLMTELIKGNRY